jgi:hypothetical protein
MSDDREWDEQALADIEPLIRAYRAALRALDSGVQSYSLDTGQTRQTVTKVNLTELRKTLAALESDRRLIRQRLGYGGSVIVTPEF